MYLTVLVVFGSCRMGGQVSRFSISNGMKRYFTVMESHSRSADGAEMPELKRSNTEPHQRKLNKEEKRRKNYGDPHHNEHGSRFLQMSQEEKRHLYKCGKNYKRENELVMWTAVWKSKKSHLQFKGKIPKSQDVFPVNSRLNDKISVEQGDITRLEIDAIVNAANSSLLGGGGVDGAIHRAAGSTLYKECTSLYGCNTGDAKITSGHCLPAKYVIHTVGPVGIHPELLKKCYLNSLAMALKFDIKSIAFPCISTGVYGYPSEDAAHVALETVRNWLDEKNHADKISKVVFCFFLNKDWEIYSRLLQFYFPCEEIEEKHFEKDHATREKLLADASDDEPGKEEDSEDSDQIEADVKNIANIPSVDMSDILDEEAKGSTGEENPINKEEMKSENAQTSGEAHEEKQTHEVDSKTALEESENPHVSKDDSEDKRDISEDVPCDSAIEETVPEKNDKSEETRTLCDDTPNSEKNRDKGDDT